MVQMDIDCIFIEKLKILANKIVCIEENTFSTSVLTLRCHRLNHLADKVGVSRIVHAQWMLCLSKG